MLSNQSKKETKQEHYKVITYTYVYPCTNNLKSKMFTHQSSLDVRCVLQIRLKIFNLCNKLLTKNRANTQYNNVIIKKIKKITNLNLGLSIEINTIFSFHLLLFSNLNYLLQCYLSLQLHCIDINNKTLQFSHTMSYHQDTSPLVYYLI